VLACIAVLYGAVAWHVSNRIGNEALRAAYDHGLPACDDAVVESVGDGVVTLKPLADDSSRVRRGPEWGLRWRGGWGTVGALRAGSAAGFTRSFVIGEGKLVPGTAVDLSVEPVRSDPRRAAGLDYQNVSIRAPLGPMPAWLVPGTSDTWAIFVHGKGADRTQALQALRDYSDRGLPCLVITYRNDRGGPASPDGKYHYGLTEWEDLEAACRFAVERGARRFLLVGYSMGGGVVLSFLERSAVASRTVAAVLDAPTVDFGRTVDLGIRLAHLPLLGAPLPPWAGTLGKGLATLRFGVNWDDYDLVERADRLQTPLLLFHGDADDVVPFEASAALAAARPDLVTLERFSGARHLESRNLDRGRYESAVTSFLESAAKHGLSE
jgi:alpha-beta hydrolase superfamily lysophospholipase